LTPGQGNPGRKTYTRLAAGRRLLSDYELTSSDLHYNHPYRFELPEDSPVVAWYYRHREGSALRVDDWQAFADPRRTTYRGYTELQDRKEDVIDGLLREIDDSDYDAQLSDEWIAFLDRWYAPLRYPAHGLQMLAAYIAQLAPSSRVTNCAAFQSTDEMRRLQRVAYRTAQLAVHRSGIDTERHLGTWEEADEFQPLRELLERALVAYDWGEAFVVTNVVIKPHIDRLLNEELAGSLADANGDAILRSIHFSLDEDAAWHREWTAAALHVALADAHTNRDVVEGWVDRWHGLAGEAVAALASVVAQAPVAGDPADVTSRVTASFSQDLSDLRANYADA
jgi:toluene monooxygenase system protein E